MNTTLKNITSHSDEFVDCFTSSFKILAPGVILGTILASELNSITAFVLCTIPVIIPAALVFTQKWNWFETVSEQTEETA